MIIDLKSVGSVIDTQTLNVYPMFNETAKLFYGIEYDDTNPTHISECGGDWLNDINEEDKAIIKIYYPQFKK
jgi:hypothetical protein